MIARTLRGLARVALVAALAAGGLAPTARAEAAKPAKKDSPARAKPAEAAVTASVEPATAKPGDTVTLKVVMKLDPGWHVFQLDDKSTVPYVPTTFDLFDPAGLKVEGAWTPSRPPHVGPLAGFDVPVALYEDDVTWSIKLKVPAGTAPGAKPLQCQAGYQICNNQFCKAPGRWTIPAAVLTVAGGGPSAVEEPPAAAAPPAPKAADATPPATPTEPAAAPIPTTTAAGAGTAAARAASTPAAGAPKAVVVNDVQRELDRGILPFLVASALGGLFALAMPCVWPMVPITVNFFVKQGQKKGGSATGLAVTYCLAIIGVFTLVGVAFSALFGAGSLSKLANNPWLNLAVAGMFLAFGLSLLGLFEIRLPNALLNASANGEGRGGLVGVMFMALTLTITSFTCTFPVVGGLLALSAGGNYLYPVIGLATFAAVLALPFFLLALAPGLMARVPKSGDWMNAVKVVGGLVEVGAAFKFLNTAEVSRVLPEDAYFNAPVVLSIWIVLSLVCGLYLLGLFRTDHDHGEGGVGPSRILLGSVFLFLALYFAPALFGNPPKGKLWYSVAALLPPDAGKFERARGGTVAGGGGERKATSSDPKVAATQEFAEHGVLWGMSYEAALDRARSEGKPVLIDFTGVNCANCRKMEQEVLPRGEVVEILGKFITVQLSTDFVQIGSISEAAREKLGEANLERELDLVNEATNPFYVALSPEGKVLATLGGYNDPSTFLGFLATALDKHEAGKKVASAR